MREQISPLKQKCQKVFYDLLCGIKPFDVFRRIIWWSMAVALVVCFTWLGGIFDLYTGDIKSLLVMGTLLIMCCSVFIAIGRIFDKGDKLVEKLRQWRKDRHADL